MGATETETPGMEPLLSAGHERLSVAVIRTPGHRQLFNVDRSPGPPRQ